MRREFPRYQQSILLETSAQVGVGNLFRFDYSGDGRISRGTPVTCQIPVALMTNNPMPVHDGHRTRY
jgi:hypothetical protein